METKPYSLQAPEQIAKGYAGNKQKIGEAAKMGLIDPTAAVLAGMFIDRMRSAQMQEQGPQQTVAQQVLSPTVPPMSPQAPSAAPAPPQAGLGAIAPQGGGMAPPPPQGPVGMAAGGYVGDQNFGSSMVNGTYNPAGAQFNYGTQQNGNTGAMFSRGMPQDSSNGLPQNNGFPQNNVGGFPQNNGPQQNNGSPQNNGPQQNNGGGFGSGGYAGGGGGYAGGGGGYAGGVGGNSSGLGMINLPPAMFDEPRNGGFNNGFNNNYAGGGIVAFAEAGEVDEEEVAPGDFMAPVIRSAILPRRAPIAPPPPVKPQEGYDAMVARASSPVEDSVNTARKMMGADTPQPGRDALRADIAKRMSPEAQRKNKEELMWTTLAQIGAGMASTKSPSFLQAAGDAMQAALPGMIAEKRAQKLDMREALKDQAAMEGMDRQEQREYVKLGMEEHSRNQQLLMEAKKLAEQGRIADANRLLQEFEIRERTRVGMAGVAAQRDAVRQAPANIQELNWAQRNPEAYKKIQDAQRNPASSPDPFGRFTPVVGSGTNSNNLWPVELVNE